MKVYEKGETIWINTNSYVGPAVIVHCPEHLPLEECGGVEDVFWATKTYDPNNRIPTHGTSSFLQSNYVYAPYIPIQVSSAPTITVSGSIFSGTGSFTTKNMKGYANKMVNNAFFVNINITPQRTKSPHYFVELPFEVNNDKFMFVHIDCIERIME